MTFYKSSGSKCQRKKTLAKASRIDEFREEKNPKSFKHSGVNHSVPRTDALVPCCTCRWALCHKNAPPRSNQYTQGKVLPPDPPKRYHGPHSQLSVLLESPAKAKIVFENVWDINGLREGLDKNEECLNLAVWKRM